MTVYTGVVGPSMDYSQGWQSIVNMRRRPGDAMPRFINATKGYEARQLHINSFMESTHEWLLMLDHDMIFAPDTLERLLAHGVPFVSGLYMRRAWAPMAPVWFLPGDEWPMMPWVDNPERGRLHELGGSGWGCILLHREVITNTRPLLKGEPEVIEDDMDIWPYDLDRVMAALAVGDIDALRDEIRPLRGDKSGVVGSDIRFPFFARQAGYTLWGDPDVRPKHIVHYPLSPDDYNGVKPADLVQRKIDVETEIGLRREAWRQRLEAWR